MNDTMDSAALLEIIRELLKTDTDLSFLLMLPEDGLKTLVSCIRDRLDQRGKQMQ